MSTTKPFHITLLEIDSFKRIVATAISPKDGKPVLLTGDNGQGKSSILDSILWAFTKSGVGKPIRDGETSATVGVKITNGTQDFIIKRRAKGANFYLDVTDADGGKIEKPQTFLDSLVGNLSFDPEAFARLKDKQQADQLREATGLDTADIDAEIERTFTLRAAANKDDKTAEANYKAVPVVSGEPQELLSAGGLAKERDELRAEMRTVEAARELVVLDEQRVSDLSSQITALQRQLEQKTAELAEEQKRQVMNKQVAAAREAAAAGHAQRISEITEALDGIDAKNAEINRHNEARRLRAERHKTWQEAAKKAADLNAKLEELRERRAAMIAEAKMPVEGLTIEADTVMLDGIPLSDLNTAKRIEVATRIAIAQNPQLGVIFVREGALINDQNLGIIAQVAEDNGMQLWVEKFQPSAGLTGLHIIEGEIAIEDGKPAAPKQLELV
jgi:DNA repair exonuclease SbcCD ATPase subunit